MCRPKLVVNICINCWLPIIINLSVILSSQCSPILLFIFKKMYLTGQSERNKLVVVVAKPPDIFGRLPRSLEDLKHWNCLLHYSRAILLYISQKFIIARFATFE